MISFPKKRNQPGCFCAIWWGMRGFHRITDELRSEAEDSILRKIYHQIQNRYKKSDIT